MRGFSCDASSGVLVTIDQSTVYDNTDKNAWRCGVGVGLGLCGRVWPWGKESGCMAWLVVARSPSVLCVSVPIYAEVLGKSELTGFFGVADKPTSS